MRFERRVVTPKRGQRQAARLVRRPPLGDVLRRLHLDVRADLVIQVMVGLATAHDGAQARSQTS
jgi:hypothetical protein